ncbi:hypothetical protein AYI68_g3913 [Smittium mucronatum]|uniref:Uncharacterized protein n=1 Tax=Smittium mucronatum TaxID=133383 RepID=A0A1R0GYP7_9FUNG|nr:hypothetical protein AYI68_g3913 [Smittium mucronatum]
MRCNSVSKADNKPQNYDLNKEEAKLQNHKEVNKEYSQSFEDKKINGKNLLKYSNKKFSENSLQNAESNSNYENTHKSYNGAPKEIFFGYMNSNLEMRKEYLKSYKDWPNFKKENIRLKYRNSIGYGIRNEREEQIKQKGVRRRNTTCNTTKDHPENDCSGNFIIKNYSSHYLSSKSQSKIPSDTENMLGFKYKYHIESLLPQEEDIREKFPIWNVEPGFNLKKDIFKKKDKNDDFNQNLLYNAFKKMPKSPNESSPSLKRERRTSSVSNASKVLTKFSKFFGKLKKKT